MKKNTDNRSLIVVDIEADGPAPGDNLYSMTELGAVDMDTGKTFYGQLKPISDLWLPEALAVSGRTREEVMQYPDPAETMADFSKWLRSLGPQKPRFFSDNNGFDWMFVCWYFVRFGTEENIMKRNPFGHSSQNIGSMYKGIIMDCARDFKHLRTGNHTHHPVDDAEGNAGALRHMRDNMEIAL